ncbi:zf-HC2 domain-containing protein [Virgibacillus sp. MSP4-1]|uniref:anti-sigma factor family protein n=1 Tax=Virgibacillus sp. MSP4-1 TaxID=2700081 RepID=UPI0003A9EABE|nr:zf-HC2 domain-containing protein [Virgibacillus sp. MSP4-1]QHS21606.1 zf-HC2 domain-containing protein [Virgibacillus sp. MSP4-1]
MPNHLSEEKIIDFIEHELPKNEEIKVQEHLDVCQDCQELFSFWTHTLNEEVEVPETRQKSIWNKLSSEVQRQRKREFKTWYKGILAVSIGALLFITGVFTGGKMTGHETATHSANQNESFVIDTKTEIYDLIHTSSGDNKGYAWYNPVRREMILYIDDDLEKHVRADIETNHSTITKGSIELDQDHQYIYVKDQELREFYRLILKNQLNQNPISSYEFRAVQLNSESLLQ